MNCEPILSKLKLITVEPVLFLYMLIIFMESNALQELTYVKSCILLYNPVNISDCSYAFRQNKTEAIDKAAEWGKYYSCSLSVFTFFSTLYVGSWSDKLGRKFPMLIPPIGTVCASLVNCLLSLYIKTHVAYFLVSSVISGITFGTVGIITTSFGFISDITDETSRSKRIVILESMLFIGGTVGIYCAGLFLKNTSYDMLNGFVVLFIFEGVVSTLLIIYIVFRIPRYTSDEERFLLLENQDSNPRLFSPKHILESFKTVFRKRECGKRKKLLLMLLTLFLVYSGSAVQSNLGYYFVKTVGWDFSKYTVFHAIQFGLQGLTLICLPGLLSIFKISDYIFTAFGMISRISGFVMFGLSTSDWMIYSCAALYMFSEFPLPGLRTLLSKIVDNDERGKIFAFTAALQNLAYLIGSFVLMTVFTEFSFKGLCFEVVAGLQGIALILIIYLFLTRHEYVTVYSMVKNADGTTTEIRSVVAASDPSVNENSE